jgi:hypothetical protein
MKTITMVWGYIKKNFRWIIPLLILVPWLIIPDKTFVEAFGFLAGIVFAGFIWYAWTHYLKNKIQK